MPNIFTTRNLFFAGLALLFVIAVVVFQWSPAKKRFSSEKTYTVAIDRTWRPLQLIGREQNLLGFTTELLEEIAKKADFNARIIETGPITLVDGLDYKRYDAIISSYTPNVVTENLYAFSNPYYLYGPVLIVRTDSEIKKPEDLEGRIIGITNREANLFVKYPSLLVVTYQSITAALEDLESNQIDAVILEAIPAYVMTEGFYAGRLKVITSPLTNQGLRLATRNEPRFLILVSRFNKGLEEVIKNGTYEKLIKKWRLIDPVLK